MLKLLKLLVSDAVLELQQESLRRLAGNPFPDWRTELYYDDQGKNMSKQQHHTDITEHGIQLPNGQVLWGSYHHWPLDTQEQRLAMVQVLKKTAEECGFPQKEFLSHYTWVTRRVQTVVTNLGTHPITATEVVGASDSAVGEDEDGSSGRVTDTGNGDGGDLRQGSVGSPA